MNKLPLLFQGLSPPDFYDWMAHNRERHAAAVVSAGAPHSNKVGLQARGLLRLLFTCSPEVWVRVWTPVCLLCDPSIHGWLVWGVALTASSALRTSMLQKQCHKMDRGAYHSAENETGLHAGLMDGNHCSSGEISITHPAVCLIIILNILHSLGYPRLRSTS